MKMKKIEFKLSTLFFLSTFLISTWLAPVPKAANAIEANVLSYGAKGDGMTNDRAAIQAAIDDVSGAGGGKVNLPGVHTYLTGGLILKSNVSLNINTGAVLKQSQVLTDYANSQTYGRFKSGTNAWADENYPLIYAGPGTHDIAITGSGKIQMTNSESGDTTSILIHTIGFFQVSRFTISNVAIDHASMNNIAIRQCDHGVITGVTTGNPASLYSSGISLMNSQNIEIYDNNLTMNGDGISIWASYHDPRGGTWWSSANPKPTHDIEIHGNQVNALCNGCYALAFINWTGGAPDQSEVEISKVNVHDNTFNAAVPIGARTDDPYTPGTKTPTKSLTFKHNTLIPVPSTEPEINANFLAMPKTDFLGDAVFNGITSSKALLNTDFDAANTSSSTYIGSSFWSTEGDAGTSNASVGQPGGYYGFIRFFNSGSSSIYQGVYLMPGTYSFTASVQSSGATLRLFAIRASDGSVIQSTTFNQTNWVNKSITFTVTMADTYRVGIDNNGASGASDWGRIDSAVLTDDSMTGTIFTTETPTVYDNDMRYELGTRFYSAVDGVISKVRIYTNAAEGGDHAVRIWKVSTNTVVAGPYIWKITAGNEGWKELTLPSPISIKAHTDYIVSVSNSSDKWYSVMPHGFDVPINNGHLITYTGSGTYSTKLAEMPTTVSKTAIYFRDIVFVSRVTGDTPSPPSSVPGGNGHTPTPTPTPTSTPTPTPIPTPPDADSIITTQTPAGYSNNTRYELGTRFYSTVDGYISKVRIYTSAAESGDHVVRIWKVSTHTVVAGPYMLTIAAGTEGWKEFALPTPLSITANTEYIVSVSTSSDKWYSHTANGFDAPINNGHLVTYTGSGTYSIILGDMPTAVSANFNYFRDIVFVPGDPPPPPPPPPPPLPSIFTMQTPAAYERVMRFELGTKFYSTVDGVVSKVRIYTNAFEGGDHVVRIWKVSTNTVVAGPYNWIITPGTEGWKEFTLPAGVSITANTDYIVSVSTSTDKWYSVTSNGFDAPINNGNLITYTGSGIFSNTLGNMPTSAVDNINYFRDIVFTPGGTLPPPPPPPPPGPSIFTTQTPETYVSDARFELGTKFRSTVDGTISKVRIYTNDTEGGDHFVRIWRVSTNTAIAGPYTWTITAGTEGWKEFTFPTPLSITANTDYIVSVSNSTDKWYSISTHGFDAPINNGNLITYVGSGTSSTSLGSMPTGVSDNANYFRDIVFVPGGTSPGVTGTIFTTQTPATFMSEARYELGTRFYTAVDGIVSKVRIYVHNAESGNHVVRIWKVSTGTLVAGPLNWTVATGTPGWQEFTLPTPVSITANTDYIVSVSNSSDKFYHVSSHGFDIPINNGDLNTYTGSGTYSTVLGDMPTAVFNNSNYFRDVVFVPGGTPPPPSSPGPSIFTTQTPAAYGSDTQYELGTRFAPTVSGAVYKVKIYTNATEGGDHVVRIWNFSANTVVAGPYTWTIAPGTEGWKEFTLPTPLNVTANTDYIVSVSNSTDKWYSSKAHGFDVPIINGNLITYTGSGSFTTVLGNMPTTVFDNTNYFRDIVFVPD